MDETVNKVKHFLEEVTKVYRLKRAILFGSRARGDYLKDSDIDLILVSEDFTGIPFLERASKLYQYWEGGLPLEVLCYTQKEFETKKRRIGLVKEAVNKGIVLR